MPKAKKGKYQSKQVYLDAALRIIRENGVEKLTMRKVAQDLDVSAMAIYKHFKNKDELLKAVLDEFITGADVLPDDDLPWDEWVGCIAERMYDALQGETNWLPLLGSFEIGENALHITFSFISKLTKAGFDNAEAFDAFMATIHTVVGAVSIQTAFSKGGEGVAQNVADNLSINPEPLVGMTTRQQIDISLPLLLDALRAKLASKNQA